MKVVYIAGPMTGIKNYKRIFMRAAWRIRRRGYIVLNPAWLPEEMMWSAAMHIDLAMVDCADIVVFLPGWAESKGARREYDHAVNRNKEIFSYDDILKKRNKTI